MERTLLIKEWFRGHSRKYLEEMMYNSIKNDSTYYRLSKSEKRKVAKKLVNNELLKYYKEEMSKW